MQFILTQYYSLQSKLEHLQEVSKEAPMI